MKVLAEELRNIGYQILWFGAGQREIGILEGKLMREESDILIAGHFKLPEELALMRHLDAMVCMDSANMHMAAMSGIPVVSIWGPTHPFAGFAPVHNEAGIVQAHLPCRPCTIYGKIRSKSGEECARRSMEMVTVEMVLERVLKSLAF
jgi:ADP-heptose:LPS heptosyltransferase